MAGTKKIIAIKITTIVTIVLLLVSSYAFAEEQTVLMGQSQHFGGFNKDNVTLLNDIAIWQTSETRKKMDNNNVIWKLIKDTGGKNEKYYMEVDNFGRTEVRPLKLILAAVRPENDIILKTGASVKLSEGSCWELLGGVHGKRLRKANVVIICYDDIDKTYRMISWDDTWQVPVKKRPKDNSPM